MVDRDELDHLFGRRGRSMVHMAGRGVVWAGAFLGAGESGVRLATAFLAGREDLPERLVMEIEHGSEDLPTVVGADPAQVMGQLKCYVLVTAKIADLQDDRLRLAGQFGLALDQDFKLRQEFARWVKEQGDVISDDVHALGDIVISHLQRSTGGFDLTVEAIRRFLGGGRGQDGPSF